MFYLMAKPAGAHCNLACHYCYYLEKSLLYPDSRRHYMSDELLEKYIREYIALQPTPNVLFTWHGGEPLMRPLEFYEKALRLQEKHACGKHIDNAIQTNATLINDRWARFLGKHNFLVGVSIDGPEHLHNHYRHLPSGRNSFQQVMRGIAALNRHGVNWNAMAAINDVNVKEPLEFYHFFKEIDCHFLQFTPVVERHYERPDGRRLALPSDGSLAHLAPFSVKPQEWGAFLIAIFQEWVKHDVGEYFVQIFDATLSGWMGMPPGVCTMAKTCGHAAVMEWNGDVYVCDHFVAPQYKLGNLAQQPLREIMAHPGRHAFGQNKQRLLTAECQECEFLMACGGECPRNRFAHSATGEPGHNYLCPGYKAFFQHAAPYMDRMKQRLLQGLPVECIEF